MPFAGLRQYLERNTVALLVGASVFACQRTPKEPAQKSEATRAAPSTASPRAASASASAPPASVPTPASAAEGSFRFPAAKRVVALGDVHGDLASTREALRLAGAIDEKDRWVGRDLVVVQVGDQLDRGDEEREIIALFDDLAEQAARRGGAVHALNGNHEIMNVAGDFRYVTPDGFQDFATTSAPQASLPRGVPPEARGRALAFSPGSAYARKLATRNTIVIVGDTLFAHAGVLKKHVEYGIGRINDEVSRFMRGELPQLPPVVASDDAPVWTRLYGGPAPADAACRELDAVLSSLSVRRLVVGHTVQARGITSACNGRVYRIDVGLSDYYGDNPTQVLEIVGERAKVLGAAGASD